MCIISPLMSQLYTASRKVMIKYVGPVLIYKTIDPQNYFLMTLDGKMLHSGIGFHCSQVHWGNTSHLHWAWSAGF